MHYQDQKTYLKGQSGGFLEDRVEGGLEWREDWSESKGIDYSHHHPFPAHFAGSLQAPMRFMLTHREVQRHEKHHISSHVLKSIFASHAYPKVLPFYIRLRPKFKILSRLKYMCRICGFKTISTYSGSLQTQSLFGSSGVLEHMLASQNSQMINT